MPELEGAEMTMEWLVPQVPMNITVGSVVRHKKTGGKYVIVTVARVEASPDECLVIYRKLEDATWQQCMPALDHTWSRPLAEFCDGRFENIEPT